MTRLWILWLLAGVGGNTGGAVPSARGWPGVQTPIRQVYERTLGPQAPPRQTLPEARQFIAPQAEDPPSLYTGPVPLVILTTEALREPFDTLAEWHTHYGLPAVVRTVSWVYARYPGSDPQERIRHFLREAYHLWGTRYVLLGGGANDLPPRYVHVAFSTDSSENWVPSDLYYACLDGTWNADGDAVFGEPEDHPDLLPELLVGRVPALFPEEAWNYVRKAMAYRAMPGGDSTGAFVQDPHRVLLLGTLIGLNHGPLYCEAFAQHLPADYTLLRLYEDEHHDNTLEDFLGALALGVGFLYINGHGNYNSVYVNYDPPLPLGNAEVETQLPNKYHLPFMKAVVCDAGAWDRFGVLSRFLLVPQTGAVGIIGTTRYDIPASQMVFDTLLAQVLYSVPHLTLGAAALSMVGTLPLVDQDSVIRYLYLSKTLMGDPALLFWQRSPRRFSLDLTSPALPLPPSPCTLRLRVYDEATGEPVPGVTVVAYKGQETYSVALTNPSGQAVLEVIPQTPGTLWVALRHGDYLPFRQAFPVQPTRTAVRVVGVELQEIQGDGDAQVDAGERFRLLLQVLNAGRDTAYQVTAQAQPVDPWMALLSTPPQPITLPPGKETLLPLPATLWVASLPPNPVARLLLTLHWTPRPDGPTNTFLAWQDTLKFLLGQPQVEFSHIRWQALGTYGLLRLSLINQGTDDAESLRLRWTLQEGSGGSITPEEILWPRLPADGQPHDTTFTVHLAPSPRFHLAVYQGWRLLWQRTWVPQTPSPPTALRAQREIQTLDLSWDAENAQGFRVFRKGPGDADFQLLTPLPIAARHYADAPVSQAGLYAYFVEAVDSLGNLSPPSETLWVALPPLHPGFPAVSGISQESNHPVAADLDPTYPGLEIVVADFLGRVYAYHADGTLVEGWPVETEPQVWNSPAVGDLDGDGSPEVVVAPRSPHNRVYVFHADGTPADGWPQSYPGGTHDGSAGAYASPVIADLDQDGLGEVILHTLQGRLLIWRYNGTPYLGSSPQVFSTGAGTWDTGTPAVADVDADGQPEILLPASTSASLYLLESDGTVAPGFPLNLGSQVKSSVAVGEILGTPTLAFVSNVGLYLGRLQWLRPDGTPFPGFPKEAFFYLGGLYAQPSFVDFNGDGLLDLVVNRGDSVVVYDTLGQCLFAAEVSRGQNFSGVVGQSRLLFYNDEEGYLRGWSPEGTLPEFPLAVYDHLTTTPVVIDLDTDGQLEYAALTAGRLLVFDLPYLAESSAWPMFQHDPRHTGFAPEPSRHGPQGSSSSPAPLRLVYPQPFRHTLQMTVHLLHPSSLTLTLYDAAGRRRARRTWHLATPGTHLLHWNPGPLPSGVYFLTVASPSGTWTQRILHWR